jgi:hypothetical protein
LTGRSWYAARGGAYGHRGDGGDPAQPTEELAAADRATGITLN